jgi:hypothetical protein
MPRKKKSQERIKVTISLTRLTYSKLIERSKSASNSISSEAHRAVEFYLENIQHKSNADWQSPLEYRMQKLENRLAGLIAKLVRVCGQALWFSTLPYTKGGLPNKPLSQDAFQMLWDQSRAFAANWLKKARIDEEQSEATQVTTADTVIKE